MPARPRAHTRMRMHAGCPALHRLELFTGSSSSQAGALHTRVERLIVVCVGISWTRTVTNRAPRTRIRNGAAVRPVLNPTAGVPSCSLSFRTRRDVSGRLPVSVWSVRSLRFAFGVRYCSVRNRFLQFQLYKIHTDGGLELSTHAINRLGPGESGVCSEIIAQIGIGVPPCSALLIYSPHSVDPVPPEREPPQARSQRGAQARISHRICTDKCGA